MLSTQVDSRNRTPPNTTKLELYLKICSGHSGVTLSYPAGYGVSRCPCYCLDPRDLLQPLENPECPLGNTTDMTQQQQEGQNKLLKIAIILRA
ncbi:hypothetical protein WISP_116755 [Willisornis vidua]|uniref:Uncharacterized protein n=1 Tax=Willisornis vidua TaxID=1566151 RepID=A0ABQ9CZN3_9PASS|nr:hypothetical protein WISP_116755 [Willisornis vidua]